MTTMTVTFPGGKRVDAAFDGFLVRTDQPRGVGGEGTAPSPFELFLASIATCAGFYAKGYCDARGLPTEGLALEMHVERDPDSHRATRLALDFRLPGGIPEKHRDGLLRAVNLCAVKQQLQHPPAIEIRVLSALDAPVGVA